MNQQEIESAILAILELVKRQQDLLDELLPSEEPNLTSAFNPAPRRTALLGRIK